ncbi:unnamed protein product, partial [Sphacelaria rigidula]
DDHAEKWLADTGTTYHVTGSVGDVFDLRPHHQGMEHFEMDNGIRLPVNAVGSLNLTCHMGSWDVSLPPSDFPIQLTDVYVVEGIKFNIFSLHHMQE